MAEDLCGRITLCFIKVRVILFFTSIGVHKRLLVYQQISITRYILTVGTSSTHQLVRVIPGQLIMVKQVNIHMYSIEVKYLLLVHIAKKSRKRDPSEIGEPSIFENSTKLFNGCAKSVLLLRTPFVIHVS